MGFINTIKKYIEGEKSQLNCFSEALKEVPKSGEVWCEGARIKMNPTYQSFNLEKANEYLKYSINFTPQYGDSFIEYLKLQLLMNGPIIEEKLSHFEQKCVIADPNYGPLWYHCKLSPLDNTKEVLKRAKQLLLLELQLNKDTFQTKFIEQNSLVKEFKIINQPIEHFITALPYLLDTFNSSNLEPSLRRKLIFGFSDNIVN